MCFTIAGFANEHVAHLWQLIECNAGKPVARGQTADYAILPMNMVPDEELQAKQLVSNSKFLKKIIYYLNVIFPLSINLYKSCGALVKWLVYLTLE